MSLKYPSTEEKSLALYFTPSSLSIALSIFIILVVHAVILLPYFFNSIGFNQQISRAIAIQDQGVFADYQCINDILNQTRFIDNLGVFVVWATIGLGLYFGLQFLLAALRHAGENFKTYSYVHANLVDSLGSEFIEFIARLVGLLLFMVTEKIFSMYVLSFSIAAVKSFIQIDAIGILFIIINIIILSFTIHIITVSLRLIFLRKRLFSS